MAYEVAFTRSARKELQGFPQKTAQQIFTKIEKLVVEPRPRGCKKLTGNADLWRIRSGDFRVVYKIYDTKKLIDVISVRHRKEAYR